MARRMAFHLPGSKQSKGGIGASACYYPPTYFQHHAASSSTSSSVAAASSHNPSSSHGLLLRATPDSDDLLLEEISVVSSNADPGHVTYGSGSLAANGPRVVPGIITSGGRGGLNERLSSSGTRLDSSSSPVCHFNSRNVDTVSSRVSGGPSAAAVAAAAASAAVRQSPIDMVTGRAASGDKRFSRDSVSGGGGGGGYANRSNAASSELDISRKTREARRRDIRSRLRLDKWEPPQAGAAPHHHPHPQSHGPQVQGVPRSSASGRPGAASGGGGSGAGSSSGHVKGLGCRWSFVFDPAGRLCYYWSMVVSLAFLYNFWVLIYRFAFQEITRESLLYWFCLDYFSDFLYLLDIAVHFRTGYLEDGVLQTDSTKLRHHYMNSTTFYIDCLCLLPLDFLYLSIGFNSILRSFRLVKIYRFWAFMDRTERHTNYPNLFRATSLIHYFKNWVFGDSESADVVKQYLQSYYWCTLALTTIGDLPRPRSKSEYLFVIAQLLFGLLLFASVLGHVANIVTNVSAARKEFQVCVTVSAADHDVKLVGGLRKGRQIYILFSRLMALRMIRLVSIFLLIIPAVFCSDSSNALVQSCREKLQNCTECFRKLPDRDTFQCPNRMDKYSIFKSEGGLCCLAFNNKTLTDEEQNNLTYLTKNCTFMKTESCSSYNRTQKLYNYLMELHPCSCNSYPCNYTMWRSLVILMLGFLIRNSLAQCKEKDLLQNCVPCVQYQNDCKKYNYIVALSSSKWKILLSSRLSF
ncbi:Hypothetical predicted protein [Cloeon dipterum]|uniref:Ion transport domain-containing protein n=1 Tax=Cloeon dipterum TaxID=197152 RepID=A0A8S1D9H1_9INSE|nr:Hypothetical predicted protein [Cloeon dipterum]